MNSYQRQLLSDFYQSRYHMMMKNFPVREIQYHSQSNYTFQDQHFLINLTSPRKEFPNVKPLAIYLVKNVNINHPFMSKCHFILF